jgi:FixJ family two-component response regulator
LNTRRQLIVIVDDEESVRRALKRLMVSAGFRAQSFASGAEFIESLRVSQPACVVLDLHMPVMSGFDIQQRLHDDKNHIPVIVITGQDDDESQQRALSAGAVAYLRKPVDDQALLHAISTSISDSPDEQA